MLPTAKTVSPRRPGEAFEMARNDLKSKEWQTEIDGLEALLRLVRFHPDLVEPDLHVIVADVTHECKNLRSQVTRAAIQTASLMVAHLDVAVDVRGLKELTQVGKILKFKSSNVPVQSKIPLQTNAGPVHALGRHEPVHQAGLEGGAGGVVGTPERGPRL